MSPVQAEAASRLAVILRGRRHTKVGHFPDKPDDTFRWRVLTGTEKQECQACAIRRFNELGIPPELRMYQDLEEELTWQVLFRGMRDESDPGTLNDPYPKSFAANVDELRDLLTVDERDALLIDYLDFESEVDPSPETVNAEVIQQITIALKKKESERLRALNDFDSATLRSYLATTVAPLLISQTGKSSPLPTDDETTKTPNPSLAPTQAKTSSD